MMVGIIEIGMVRISESGGIESRPEDELTRRGLKRRELSNNIETEANRSVRQYIERCRDEWRIS